MQCQDARRKISAYMDGEIDPESARSLEHHMSRCGPCREAAADFRDVDSRVRSLWAPGAAHEGLKRLLVMGKEPRSATAEKRWDRSPLSALIRLMSSIVDLMETRRSSMHTLDELDDFPPLFLGSIYLKMLNQPGRG